MTRDLCATIPGQRSRLRGRMRRIAAMTTGAALLALPLSGCTSTQTEGQSPAYLIVDSLLGASGATPDKFSGTLASDVITLVKVSGSDVLAPTVYEDTGQVT